VGRCLFLLRTQEQIEHVGIDYLIDYGCPPKHAFSLAELVARLKGKERAERIIRLYRDNGDWRPPSEMGFEFVRRAADGAEETEVVIVQNLLDAAAELEPWAEHCRACPANRFADAFGCMDAISYPITERAERWLLARLPEESHPLPYMLLQKAIREHGYKGEIARKLRAQQGVFFEAEEAPVRDLHALHVSGDQVFEMLFLAGHIQPAHGSLLLQFFGGISQDLDPDVIMQLAAPPSEAWIEENVPFLLAAETGDPPDILAFKRFFEAMYWAFRLRVALLLDV